ncbi:MAG: 4Fe-4S dicluster domain-containing protein [Candidatus Promineifilaceae bacterium]|nr:4Fe-4S dicluster domain-containing protein [Candidatus Promineifilaceae bacterium]
MLYRTITKENFRKMIKGLMEKNDVFGPKWRDRDQNGNKIYRFLKLNSFDELQMDYTRSYSSPKNFFIPFKEDLVTYKLDDADWEQEIEYTVHPRVIVGMRACDINALRKLDEVMLNSVYPNPYYAARRRNTIIIGLDHEPLEDCFCHSMNANVALSGFDLFLTDIGDKYFVAINSDTGFRMVNQHGGQGVTEEDQSSYKQVKREIESKFKTQVDVTIVPELMDLEFESEVWKKWGDKCLSCGSCAMVCPTCYCYGVDEEVDLTFSQATKRRCLYSCNLLDFAAVAGDHNFRPEPHIRLKYRYYHQFRGFVEAFNQSLCVGCNRCGVACLAGIHPKAVIDDLIRTEK